MPLHSPKDTEGVVLFQEPDLCGIALHQQDITHPQGDLAQLAGERFALSVDAQNLKSMMFAKTHVLKRAARQPMSGQENHLDQHNVLPVGRVRIRERHVRLDLNSWSIADLQDILLQRVHQEHIARRQDQGSASR